MKKNNKSTTFRRGAYASPSVAITRLEGRGQILENGSKGTTQNYDIHLIWELGADNE